MNAPEKIYLNPIQDALTDILSEKTDGDIEYTRTDAFIEKAYEFFDVHLCEYINVRNANCVTFINIDGDKLKEDFKNYMKGE